MLLKEFKLPEHFLDKDVEHKINLILNHQFLFQSYSEAEKKGAEQNK
jgi:hypothetical protein